MRSRLTSMMWLVAIISVAPTVISPIAHAAPSDAVRIVQPGESIQAALDAVPPGGTVMVQPGEYRENLEIAKDGVTLQGNRAVLLPPVPTQPRRCSIALGLADNPLGICVASDLEPGPEPVPRHPIRNVVVRGLTVRDFPVTGIVIYGGQDTRIENNTLTGGTAYGLLASSSTGTLVSGNTVTGGNSAGIYIGDSPLAQARVVGNRVTGAGLFGIYIRNASHGMIAANTVEGACVGLILSAVTPDRGTVSDWRATANVLRHNNRVCFGGTLTGIGVLLAGTDRVTINHNLMYANQATSPEAQWGGGVVLTGGLAGGPAQPADTNIVGNVLYDNSPFDITLVDPGIRTTITMNVCATSSPTGFC